MTSQVKKPEISLKETFNGQAIKYSKFPIRKFTDGMVGVVCVLMDNRAELSGINFKMLMDKFIRVLKSPRSPVPQAKKDTLLEKMRKTALSYLSKRAIPRLLTVSPANRLAIGCIKKREGEFNELDARVAYALLSCQKQIDASNYRDLIERVSKALVHEKDRISYDMHEKLSQKIDQVMISLLCKEHLSKSEEALE